MRRARCIGERAMLRALREVPKCMTDARAELLSEFQDDGGAVVRTETGSLSISLLLFTLDTQLFGLEASSVDAVIAWKTPVPLPKANSPRWAGVVQDRGRIIGVLGSVGSGDSRSTQAPTRLLVCSTARGHVGLPAHSTQGVVSLSVRETPKHEQLIDTPQGVFVVLTLEALLASMSDSQ